MQTPQQADIFLIPLLDGGFGVGQVVEVSATPQSTALVMLTLLQSAPNWPPSPIHYSESTSLVLVQDNALKDGSWHIVGFEMLPPIGRLFKIKEALSSNFENVAFQESAIVEAFVNACHGLYPWDGFPDPQFFNKLLIYPDQVPSGVKYKRHFA